MSSCCLPFAPAALSLDAPASAQQKQARSRETSPDQSSAPAAAAGLGFPAGRARRPQRASAAPDYREWPASGSPEEGVQEEEAGEVVKRAGTPAGVVLGRPGWEPSTPASYPCPIPRVRSCFPNHPTHPTTHSAHPAGQRQVAHRARQALVEARRVGGARRVAVPQLLDLRGRACRAVMSFGATNRGQPRQLFLSRGRPISCPQWPVQQGAGCLAASLRTQEACQHIKKPPGTLCTPAAPAGQGSGAAVPPTSALTSTSISSASTPTPSAEPNRSSSRSSSAW